MNKPKEQNNSPLPINTINFSIQSLYDSSWPIFCVPHQRVENWCDS